MKSTYYVASSLDGFIADESGGVGWLDEVKVDPGTSSYEQFYSTVDGLMMGRATYDFIFDYGSWPYGEKPAWIVTSRPVERLPGANLQASTELETACKDAQSLGIENLWVVGGGKLIASLIQRDLLTHIRVTIMPVVLGKGIPFVDALPAPCFLTQELANCDGGNCEIVYRVGA